MQAIEVKNKVDLHLQPFQKESLNLFLLIEEHSISASIFSADNSIVHHINSLTFTHPKISNASSTTELAYFLNEFGLLKHAYKHVTVQILNRLFTLVPQSYVGGNLKEVLAFNLGLKEIRNVNTDLINNAISFAYTYDFELVNFIEKTFSACKINHAGATSIDLFLRLQSLKNSDVFLNIHTSTLELIIKRDNELLFYNIFKWDSNEDILYFLLFSIEQFQLNQSTVRLIIAGNIPTNNELFTLIKKYIKTVNFISSKAITKSNEQLANHYFFNILNHHLCEL